MWHARREQNRTQVTVGNLEGEGPMEEPQVKWVNNIKMDTK
jgi:hypothetical protein